MSGHPTPSCQLRSLTVPSYTSSPPVHYTITLQLSLQTWSVQRRFSHFLTLHSHLSSLGTPPASLPSKQRPASYFFQRVTGASESEDELRQRRHALQRYLNDIWNAKDPRWREARAFKDFLEWPLDVPLLPPCPTTAPSNSNNDNAASKSLPASLPPSSAYCSLGTAPPLSQRHANSSAHTLYAAQQSEMDKQDSHLENLTAILRQQRNLGETINTELQQQTQLLTTLDQEVDTTQNNMSAAEAKMQKVEAKRGKRMFGFA